MRPIFFFLFSLISVFNILPFTLKAQHRPDFDSIRAEIKIAQSERDRINLIIRYGNSFAPSQADSILHYAEKLSDEPASNELARAGELFLRGVSLSKKSRLNEAKAPLLESLSLFEELQDFELYFMAANHLGRIYTRNREYEEALKIYNRLLAFGEHLNPHMEKVANGNLGIIHRHLGAFYKAINHFEKTIALDPSDKFSVANAHMQISNIFQMLDFPVRALSTLNKISEDSLPLHPIKVAYFNNKGRIFTTLGEIDSAIHYLTKGVEAGNNIKQYHQVVKPSAALVRLHGVKGDFDEAEEVLQEMLSLCPEFCPPPVNIDMLLASGEHYLNVNKIEEAIGFFEKALTLAKNTNQEHNLQNAYLLLSKAYEKNNDEVKALAFQKKHTHLSDSLKETKQERFLAEARTRFETAEKEDMLQKSEAEKSFFQDLFFQMSFVALVLLAVGFFLYKRYKKKNEKLVLKVEEVTTLNQQLQERQQRSDRVDIFPKYLVLKSKAKIDLDQLQYIYVDGHYLEYYTSDRQRPEIDRNSLSSILEELPESQFIRVHRSFVVNLNFVKAIYSSKVMLEDGKEVPVSRTFKSNIEEILLKQTGAV